MDHDTIADITQIQQLLARYAVYMSQHDVEGMVSRVFAPGGTYSAFGDVYSTTDFPRLMEAAPRGLYTTGLPLIELDGDTASGVQTLQFVAQATHELRIGYYTDTYTRTEDGWRLQTRRMTFMRRNGAHDSGRPHDPGRPTPSATNV
ncbi:nuclear transport factor 2 family protein [Aeromicrobium choanae]|uniref:SnoaL-like domain-containing protein n=1 Tax=Aeromicrobium choanae TaxID=1736691 RepID=A0A1T4YWI3_9ACTN|nr:nuclear transport factor 2 family protein [Aeromicrobium choanae]SKB06140.1 SnoaL-like domain-containing protein [Aeromicrobium choanae]